MKYVGNEDVTEPRSEFMWWKGKKWNVIKLR
jgi:hypothetical protein